MVDPRVQGLYADKRENIKQQNVLNNYCIIGLVLAYITYVPDVI